MNELFVKVGKKLDVQMTNTNDKTGIVFLGKREVSFICDRLIIKKLSK